MRRIYLNIAAFGLITALLIAWSAVSFLHLDAIERPYRVTAEFAESPGLRAGYEVTYLGHAIGHIRGVRLAPGMSEVELAIDRGVELPADVVAAARRRSAIGEPYVDLAPTPGTDPDAGPRLADGDRIALSKTSSPLKYGDLFRSLETLVETIDPSSLSTVVSELAAALDGRGDDIRRIVQGSQDLTRTLSDNGDEIEHLIDGVAEITDVLATHRDALGSGIDHLAGLTQALEQARPSFDALVEEGPSSIAVMNAIVDASDSAIICTIDGTAELEAVLDTEALQSLTGLLQRSRAFADVVGLVQDSRDGIFRLMISPSGGHPPTVEFVQPKPFPESPPVATCPAHDVAIATATVSDQAGAEPGGRRPSSGASSEVPGRTEPTPTVQASGTNGPEAGASPIARFLSSLWSLMPLIAGLALGALLLFLLARRRGRTR